MRKCIALILSIAIIFALSACGEKTEPNPADETSYETVEISSVAPREETGKRFTTPIYIGGNVYFDISVYEFISYLSDMNEDVPKNLTKYSDEFFATKRTGGMVISIISDGSEEAAYVRSVRVAYVLDDPERPSDEITNKKMIQLCRDVITLLDSSADLSNLESDMRSGYFYVNDISVMASEEDGLMGFLVMSAFGDN